MKQILLTMIALFMLSANCATAQVTIGELKDPESFSILELVSTSGGLRLPQMSNANKTAAFGTDNSTLIAAGDDALGLQIFNIDTECVETWNGVEWIKSCSPSGPAVPSKALSAVSCGITASSDNKTFTAIADPKAVKYEFFVGKTNPQSQGVQTDNMIIFATAQTPGDISVKYYYALSYLRPTMIPVAGSNNWKYGDSNTATTASIPDLQWSETEITQAQFEAVFPDRATITTRDYNQPCNN
jgi:hypothetical protein